MSTLSWEWHDDAPAEDGDFFYYGSVPDSGEPLVAIVQITTNPDTAERIGSLMIPAGWRGQADRKHPTVHFGTLDKWRGQWAGPEYGLCCTTV